MDQAAVWAVSVGLALNPPRLIDQDRHRTYPLCRPLHAIRTWEAALAVDEARRAHRDPASQRLASVDSLRAIAMIVVIAQHADLFPFGWLGVQIFFVISGFVVTLSVIDNPPAGQSAGQALRQFYQRRIARIMPGYYAYVLLAMILTLIIGAPFEAGSRLAQSLFWYNFYLVWLDTKPLIPTSHLWSLSVEMQFYLLFGPVLMFVRRAWLGPGLMAAIVLVTVSRLWCAFDVARLQQVSHFSPWQFDAFAAGALLALHRQWLDRRRARLLLIVGIAAMTGFIVSYMAVNYHFGARGMGIAEKILSGNAVGQGRAAVMFTPIMLLSAGLVASAATPGAVLHSLLDRPRLVRIGRASYSGYLIHFLILVIFQQALTDLFGIDWTARRTIAGLGTKALLVCLAAPATVVLADMIHVRFEVPASRLVGRWLAGPWFAAKPAAAVAS